MGRRRRRKPNTDADGWDDVTRWIADGCRLMAARLGVLEREWGAYAEAHQRRQEAIHLLHSGLVLVDTRLRELGDVDSYQAGVHDQLSQEIKSLRADLVTLSASVKTVHAEIPDVYEWVELKLEALAEQPGDEACGESTEEPT